MLMLLPQHHSLVLLRRLIYLYIAFLSVSGDDLAVCGTLGSAGECLLFQEHRMRYGSVLVVSEFWRDNDLIYCQLVPEMLKS